MAEAKIQLQRGRRFGRSRRGAPPTTLLPLHLASPLSNTISCWYCDFKSSAFNEPIFHFGQKYSRCLRMWFSIGMGFSLTTLIGVTMIILLESARALNLYHEIPWLSSILNGPILGFYSSVNASTDFTELTDKDPWLSSTRLVVKPDMLFGKHGKIGLVALNLDVAQVAEFVKARLGVEVMNQPLFTCHCFPT